MVKQIFSILKVISKLVNFRWQSKEILINKIDILKSYQIEFNDYENNIVIFPHLGLGDQIIINGLINVLSNSFDNIYIFCKIEFIPSVYFLYINNPKVQLIPIINQLEGELLFNNIKIKKIKLGYEYLRFSKSKNFDEQFYEQLKINFEHRWKSFRLTRNKERENYLFNKLNLPKEYIFLHEDENRGYEIERKFILSKNLPIIKPNRKYTPVIFDWLKVIENAKEIHCIDSSFKNLVDSILTNRNGLFLHLRLKNNKFKDYWHSSNKLNWNIIK